MMNTAQWQPILNYWFGDQDPPTDDVKAKWFSGSEATDTDIRNRFAASHQQVSEGLPKLWQASAEGVLAGIIVIDQFSRNLFRGTDQAFAWDPMALDWSQSGWRQGLFAPLTDIQKAFAVMPLMHSEAEQHHLYCQEILQDLILESTNSDTILTGFLSSAKSHHAIISQFGRYPHRNEVLGRSSTEEEIQYLTTGAKRFGQ